MQVEVVMSLDEQKSKANAFRAMHRVKILVLPNAWDVASARIFENAGFGAIATTSAGVAFTLGNPDGEKISREEMLARVARAAREAIEAGAVGMNLEDGTDDGTHPLAELSLQLERIRAVREAALKTGVLLVLNARTDVYLAKVGDSAKRYDETVRRLVAFRDAGADCVFAPGLTHAETIRQIVQDVKCPVNI